MSSISDGVAPSEERHGALILRGAGYWLHLVRAIEDAGLRLYKQGRLPGSFYDGRGQEATAVGVALAMGERDVACALIRDMGVHLVRGVPTSMVIRHYLGKAGGPTEGVDGNIHFGSIDNGTLPMVSHLPEMIPVGMGVALGRCWRGEDSVAVCFCGDGAANGGIWHESMNLAAVWAVPLVVVIERNGWAYSTASSSMLAVEQLGTRAIGYGGQSLSVDGNDVCAVYAQALGALAFAREERRPVILEAWTYRMHGHGAHDGQRYVPTEELEHWAARDPLKQWRQWAEAEAAWLPSDQEQLERAIRDEVAAAVEDAVNAPFPASERLEERVYAR